MSGLGLGERAIRRAGGIRSRLASRYFLSLGGAAPDIIFIAGTGRSGTTWLAETLTRSMRRRLVFEPFRNDRVSQWSDALSRQYIRPDDSESPFREPARKILDPEFRNDWADYYNELFLTRGRIVKDIRANLMLRWLYEQFGPFPLIFMIRHPGAVAASWLRERWHLDPAETFLQPNLVDDYLRPFRQDLLTATSDPLACVLWTWAIETAVPLQQFGLDEMIVVFYEDLVSNPARELQRLNLFLGRPVGPNDVRSLSRPSSTTTPGVSYGSQAERLTLWRSALTDEQTRQTATILSRLGLDSLYGDDGFPAFAGDEVQRRLRSQSDALLRPSNTTNTQPSGSQSSARWNSALVRPQTAAVSPRGDAIDF
jgi:Sulfotransferase family